jgi:hypothetical protein
VTEGFSIEALNSAHNRKGRKGFSSGVEPLDRYFRELVMQDVKRRASNCFVVLDGAGAIAGYYTFAAASLPLTELSADEKQRLLRHALLPAGLIGPSGRRSKISGTTTRQCAHHGRRRTRGARGLGNIRADCRRQGRLGLHLLSAPRISAFRWQASVAVLADSDSIASLSTKRAVKEKPRKYRS